jgi:hypothetical protein
MSGQIFSKEKSRFAFVPVDDGKGQVSILRRAGTA